MTPDQISQTLTQRWAMSAYPRNLSPHVINRILEKQRQLLHHPSRLPRRERGVIITDEWIAVAGIIVGAIGLIVSAAAFIIAVWQIRKTQSAAESAARAATEAREVLSQVASISDLSQIIGQLDQLKELHRNQEWKRAMDRYSLLLRLLTEARASIPEAEKDENVQVFLRAIMQLRAMAREVDIALEQGFQLSSAKIQ